MQLNEQQEQQQAVAATADPHNARAALQVATATVTLPPGTPATRRVHLTDDAKWMQQQQQQQQQQQPGTCCWGVFGSVEGAVHTDTASVCWAEVVPVAVKKDPSNLDSGSWVLHLSSWTTGQQQRQQEQQQPPGSRLNVRKKKSCWREVHNCSSWHKQFPGANDDDEPVIPIQVFK
ncbi:hypothetical protein ACLKA7_006370 [Drosophila subpalustris]